tara:strand:- start:2104 stop:2472 length:369 start_codon:yes stop_codon:yes gene_type:complete
MHKIDTITLPITIESRNKLDKMHWAAKRRLRQTYCLLVRNQMRLNNIPLAKLESEYEISILVFRRYRIRDYDNLVGGCKQLLDALTREDFIFDDDTKYIGIPTISQQQSKTDSVIISRIPKK